ncbi:redoxin domain-containing protein [Microbacterium sp. zg.B48]|uniref:redoxin domain-containing protein n=1 Tax=Microbacterium sp. zg.B48 TaxID=2969408 RepID=UPI00214C89C0|nr:redoxin domain-containing protein [Microbacterium sp. zg.B48]MCR2765158.1 redoxin domain-containing protein [Microbacterium sp. zg.B48]
MSRRVGTEDAEGPVDTPARGGLVRSIAHRLAGDRELLPDEGRLPSFDRATGWLQSDPLTPVALRGRVVLVDFWTYTCVNWLRTLPYLSAWHAKYADAGLSIIGVHTPEFGFEHSLRNVRMQAQDLGVRYPVAIDNDYGVWDEFANHYWPALYIADAAGRIRFHHYGEGEYERTEMVIQRLLVDAGSPRVDRELVLVDPVGVEVAADWRSLQSPETYLGYAQSAGFASEDPAAFDRRHAYSGAARLPLNGWDLTGEWTVTSQAVVADRSGGRISFAFHARDVNLVMGPARAGESIPFRILLDGEAVGDSRGTDAAADGTGVVLDQKTYQLVRQPEPIVDRLFEIEFGSPGVEAYCFTFG